MTLHEKGKATLKKKQYGDALYLLLEADKEFKYESKQTDTSPHIIMLLHAVLRKQTRVALLVFYCIYVFLVAESVGLTFCHVLTTMRC